MTTPAVVTPREQDCLCAISSHVRVAGKPPTAQALATFLSLGTRSAEHALVSLARKGMVAPPQRRWHLTAAGEAYLARALLAAEPAAPAPLELPDELTLTSGGRLRRIW